MKLQSLKLARRIFNILLFIFLSINLIKGQAISKKIITSYDSYELEKLYSLMIKTNLSEKKQLEIVKLFKDEGNKIKEAIIKSKSEDTIEQIRKETLIGLSLILDLNELEQYLYSQHNSLLFEVTLFTEELALSKDQIGKLLEADNLLNNKKSINKYFDIEKSERDYLKEILTFSQATMFMAHKTSEQAKNRTMSDWNALLKFEIITPVDSQKVWCDIEFYNKKREVIIELFKDKRSIRDSYLRELDKNKSNILKELENARNEDKYRSQFNPTNIPSNNKVYKQNYTW
ncbi:MAG: hypothetical protein JW870_15455 [Candidatus Delongbacteria bacterium]|nr:hypothetical protein [Candidatus Delongbacteria bacterium]